MITKLRIDLFQALVASNLSCPHLLALHDGEVCPGPAQRAQLLPVEAPGEAEDARHRRGLAPQRSTLSHVRVLDV